MGRRPVKNKKLPSDYPVFGFRVSTENKKELLALIEETQAILNRRRGEDDDFVNKNDVIVKALRAGLKKLKSGN